MGRPRLGDAAKNHTATIRLTRSEKILLTRMYGSATKGLREILDQWKTQRGTHDDS